MDQAKRSPSPFPADFTTRRRWGLLAAFLLALLFFHLGGRGLNEPDEARYAEVAREGLFSPHPWWDPHLAGLGHYDKPPLIYWTTELSFAAFGLNEFSARLPCVLGLLMTLAGVGWAAARRHGERVAFVAMLVAGTTAHLWAMARMLSTDMLLTGFITLAIAAWIETRTRGGAWRWWLLQVLFWCLALWTKATPALVPLAALSLWVYLAGNATDRRALRLPLLLPLALLLATPWFIAMIHLHPGLKDFYLGREVESRISGHIGGRRGPLYYYMATSLIAWLPWWPFALAAGWRSVIRPGELWRERLRRWGPEAAVVIVGFAVFSLIPSKQHTYVLPLAPWVALLMARALAQRSRRFLWSVAGTAAVLYLALILLAPKFQAHLGRNSSVAPVVKFMRAHGAHGIVSDHFCPGFIFYGGDDVRFIDVPPTSEIPGETSSFYPDLSSSPFRPGDWFAHFQGQSETSFAKWLADPRIEKHRIGDFIVGPVPP
jgi:4-amino-4-deoxy-L-arabinose transferase-like glycosyltransferase